MNVYLQEIKIYWKSWLIWTVSTVAIAALFLTIFPTFSQNAIEVKKLLAGFPASIRQAFGISLDNIATFKGYYNYIFPYIMLCGAIQAMILGVSLFSKESREKTADFLLSKPISRQKIATAKLMASFSSILCTSLVYIPTIYFIAQKICDTTIDVKSYLLVSLCLPFIQLVFTAIGIFISMIVSRIKGVLPISLGVVLAFYFLDMIYKIMSSNAIRYISPFSFFDLQFIIENNKYQNGYLLLSVTLSILLIIASQIIYQRKDIA